MNTGGPASGKTILDDFAQTALEGLLSNPNSRGRPEVVVSTAWGYAKLMLEHRAIAMQDGKPGA